MTDTVRCPSCRGAKKVAKLGGIVGECNTCKGKGTILAADKPVTVVAVVAEPVSEVIAAVADCMTVSDIKPVANEPSIKVDGKRAIYKRKTASK